MSLDTNAGTLSFGLLSTSSNQTKSTTPSDKVFSLGSRGTPISSSSFVDWGVAFEGLPLDAKLYPAVGLYQRDDKVTLLSVKKEEEGMTKLDPDGESSNANLTQMGIDVTLNILKKCHVLLQNGETNSALLDKVVPSLAANLCLIPYNDLPRWTCGKYALQLLPLLSELIKLQPENYCKCFKEGKWTIRSKAYDEAGSLTSDLEEYSIRLRVNDHSISGKGRGEAGRNKNGNVDIIGTIKGTLLHFIEDWSDRNDHRRPLISSTIIEARMSLDGTRFEGEYYDVNLKKAGKIAGVKMDCAVVGRIHSKVLLCRAASHLAGMICGDPVAMDMTLGISKKGSKWKSNKIFHSGLRIDNQKLEKTISDVRSMYFAESSENDESLSKTWNEAIMKNLRLKSLISFPTKVVSKEIDDWASKSTGGDGSLAKINPENFSTTKRTILAAILYHTQSFQDILSQFKANKTPSKEVKNSWRAARSILEDSFRTHISKLGAKRGSEMAFENISILSNFLLRINSPCLDESLVLQFFKKFSVEDISKIENDMEIANKQACLRMIGFAAIRSIVMNTTTDSSMEACLLPLARMLSQKRSQNHSPFRGSYLLGLEGSSLDSCVQKEMNLLQVYLFDKLQGKMRESSSLVVLSCLHTSFHQHDFKLISSKKLLDSLSKILEDTRKYLDDPPISDNMPLSLVTKWHLKRKVFCSTFYAFYLLIVQIGSNEEAQAYLGDSVLSIIEKEFNFVISWATRRAHTHVTEHATGLLRNDINNWSKICFSQHLKLNQVKDTSKENSINSLSLKYMQKYGGVKKFIPNVSTNSSTGTERIVHPLASPENYLSGLLNTLYAVFRSNSYRNGNNHTRLIQMLLEAAKDEVLPCRGRMLRLLRLAITDSDVDDIMIKQILVLAGKESRAWNSANASLSQQIRGKNVCTDYVGREAVSLLRHLYTNMEKAKMSINRITKSFLKEDWNKNDEAVQGCLTFVAGAIRLVSIGSYVLFKPMSAIEKNNGRHVVGGGIESILSGLSRKQAYAGLVSNLYSNSGSCEVILVHRTSKSNEVGFDDTNSPGMMVRAARVPVSDVVCAEEIPLVVDDGMLDIVKILLHRLRSILEDIKQAERKISTIDLYPSLKSMALDLFAIRCALQILADKSILRSLCASDSKSPLPLILQIASTSASIISSDNLTQLRLHETQYVQLCAEFSALQTRRHALNIVPPTQLNISTSQKDTESKDFMFSSNLSRVTTPPVTNDDGDDSVSTADTNSANAISNSSNIESSASASASNDEEEAHLREAAIVQMAELGLPRSWSELALRRTGGTNVEAAVHFCLERGGEMEHMLIEERERNLSSNGSSQLSGANTDVLIQQLLEMGFPDDWCRQALEATRNNVDDALTWILTNGERLSGQDVEDDDDDDDDEDDSEDNHDADDDDNDVEGHYDMILEDLDGKDNDIEETNPDNVEDDEEVEVKLEKESEDKNDSLSDTLSSSVWAESICPVRFVSGRSSIDSKTLSIAGLSSGGFSSVGTKGILLTSGKWYYEAELLTAGCLQIGWADGSFAGHCHAEKGDGCGDGPSSWAFDGWRRYRWHGIATEWGSRWQVGDIIGCSVDLDNRIVSFTLNGQGEEIGMGKAFEGESFRPCGGVYACASFNWKEKLKISLKNFKYGPPEGFKGIGEAIVRSVNERNILVNEEEIIQEKEDDSLSPRFLCDFSDGEHGHELFAWQHRYYGNDASVHLGSGKGNVRKLSKTNSSEVTPGIQARLRHAWSKTGKLDLKSEENITNDESEILSHMNKGYVHAESKVFSDIRKESLSLSILYAKKLILEIVLTLSRDFSLDLFLSEKDSISECARRFWQVLDCCCSLRSAGWVGEASAMAIAAEALGLGIATHDTPSSGSRGNSSNNSSIGLTQSLTSVMFNDAHNRDVSNTFAACAEAAMGGEGGGSLIFLREGLQTATSKSRALQDVLVAAIRRAVRLLAVVEYNKEDSVNSDVSFNLISLI